MSIHIAWSFAYKIFSPNLLPFFVKQLCYGTRLFLQTVSGVLDYLNEPSLFSKVFSSDEDIFIHLKPYSNQILYCPLFVVSWAVSWVVSWAVFWVVIGLLSVLNIIRKKLSLNKKTSFLLKAQYPIHFRAKVFNFYGDI